MRSAPTQQSTGGNFLGFPLEGFSFFQSMLLALALGFFTFFAATFLAIVGLLVWNGIFHHTVDFADTYLYVGFPAGVLMLLIALPFFGTLWIRAKFHK